MNTHKTSVQVLRGGEVSFIAEARAMQDAARAMRARVVRLRDLVFFSTATGDAWMLDPRGEAGIPYPPHFTLLAGVGSLS